MTNTTQTHVSTGSTSVTTSTKGCYNLAVRMAEAGLRVMDFDESGARLHDESIAHTGAASFAFGRAAVALVDASASSRALAAEIRQIVQHVSTPGLVLALYTNDALPLGQVLTAIHAALNGTALPFEIVVIEDTSSSSGQIHIRSESVAAGRRIEALFRAIADAKVLVDCAPTLGQQVAAYYHFDRSQETA